MNSLTIDTSTNKYNVFVGTKLRFKTASFLEKQYKNILIVTDDQVANHYLDDVKNSFSTEINLYSVVVPAGESSKSQEQYFNVISRAIEVGLDRQSLIIALGGGMVGDLAGFAASTYMRGIDYIQVPTSILAHDSSVGGKVAINHTEGKNLIGSFYPPQAVIYDVETLHSLPEKEVRSGYAEIVKHGLISDEIFFHQVLDTKLSSKIPDEVLTDHLLKGINVKATIVQNDEKENNVRKYLNFGHTLGHALEANLGYGQITHGEAVAIGMLFALRVSEKVYGVKLPYQPLHNWLVTNNYPLHLPTQEIDPLVNRMKKDKKSINNLVQMVLLKSVGQPTVEKIEDELLKSELDEFMRELVNH
ncbi:3-dehydroquinate synthase [Aquibacillus halophilus]|uniref:3-dehydroquinate synthase n=1 Tax=Aquibacillus halophilus TaxID=930132 RepID=A0A6A8D9X1_9BACI|nr:3-dehydroquinate synthase [Aquibacillus halophilus]MRH42404.1 3-dehydroquinate synthase [Aquibacillus halophilus]